MYIPQAQLERLSHLVAPGRVAVLYGPRRVGKTTLIRRYAGSHEDMSTLLVTGEDVTVRSFLESQSVSKLRQFVGKRDLLIVDEAQAISNVGRNLKLLVDHVPELRIIATGSSSFDLAQQTGEPLTGRKVTLLQLPLAQLELQAIEAPHETLAHLEDRLIYGSYPEVVLMADNDERALYLRELVSSYLFKDILELENIRHADTLSRLLRLLAFQIGQEVSINELGTQLGMSKNTVDRYLDLLEKVFVIFQRSGFSRNLRKEVTKSRRYYFYDIGIRNALIEDLSPLDLRNDVGQLWENYICVERLKYQLYTGKSVNNYFWRTYDQQELDLVEESGGKLHAYECKWGPGNHRCPAAWRKSYPDATFNVIHPDNYLNYIL